MQGHASVTVGTRFLQLISSPGGVNNEQKAPQKVTTTHSRSTRDIHRLDFFFSSFRHEDKRHSAISLTAPAIHQLIQYSFDNISSNFAMSCIKHVPRARWI